MDELLDWYGFFLWDIDPNEGPDDADKIAFLNQVKKDDAAFEQQIGAMSG